MEKIQLEPDETILTKVRKHWFILASKVFGIFIAGLMPLVLFPLIAYIGSSFEGTLPEINGALATALTATWLLILWMVLFNIWTNYYLDLWILTNKRIIAIDQRGLFNRSISSFRLERLQDLNVEIIGIIATFLDFGSLKAQTAGTENWDFKVSGLPQPRELKALILKASDSVMANVVVHRERQMEV